MKCFNFLKLVSISSLLTALFCVQADRNNATDSNGGNWNPPEVVIQKDTSINVNDTIAIHAIATDNGAIVKYLWTTNDATFTDTTATAFFLTAFKSEGEKKVFVKVVDNDGVMSKPDTCVVTVTLDPPVVIAMNDASVNINDSITITAIATDNGSIIEYRWSFTGNDYPYSTRSGSFRTAFGSVGAKKVWVKVVDDDGLVSKPDTCVITVTLDPPKVVAMKDTSVNINDSIAITATATDNGTIIKYYWALNGTSYYDSTTTGSLKTAFNSAGVKKFLVKVLDDDGLVSQPDTCVITVTLGAPVLTHKKDTVVSQTMSVTENVVAIDTNTTGSIVKYYWDIGSNGWDDSTNTPQYTFSKSEGGLMTVVWGARDDDGLIRSDTFMIIFNRIPATVVMTVPVNGDTAKWAAYDPNTGKGSVTMRFAGTDPDGVSDTVTYTLSLGKSAGVLSPVYNGKNTSYTATGLDTVTTYYWRITARDLWGDSVFSIGIFMTNNGAITDIDGNIYTTVKIGTQTWMVENLKTTKYNDGTAIPLVTSNTAWGNIDAPGYCWYGNDVNNKAKYGALYSWYTGIPANPKKIAPAGWHVPTDAEWDTLQNYLIANGYNWDGTTTGNKIAKAMAAKTDWSVSTTPGTIGNDLTKNNGSGFSALPGGYRNESGTFFGQSNNGYWWSATEGGASYAWYRSLIFGSDYLFRYYYFKRCGLSLRLVRD